MMDEMLKELEEKYKIKVYEIKYVDLKQKKSVVSKLTGYKHFADFAIKVLGLKNE